MPQTEAGRPDIAEENSDLIVGDLPWLPLGGHLRINLPRTTDSLALIRERFTSGRGFTLATLNLDHAVLLEKPGAFRDAYARHSHITADGHPIAWLARRRAAQVERVTGADLVQPATAIAAELGVPIAIIGARPEVLERCTNALTAQFPALKVALTSSPSYPFDPEGTEADTVIAQVKESGARLVFLALGAPRQEILAARLGAAAPEIGVMSVGAGIDFIAGTAARAPVFFQRTGLEWLWRLLREPGRLGPRYWRCARLLPRLALRNRRQ